MRKKQSVMIHNIRSHIICYLQTIHTRFASSTYHVMRTALLSLTGGVWGWVFVFISLTCSISVQAQTGAIRIGGNIYGGGNKGDVKGSTKVTVYKGDIGAVTDPEAERPLADPLGRVFGGARMANVGGNTFVHIDGEHASDYILINQVYGGNDIAGTIGKGTVPSELTAIKRESHPEDATDPKRNEVDNKINSFVRVSTLTKDSADAASYYTAEEIAAAENNPESPAYGKRTTDIKPDPNAKKVYIGQLFAGGNGDFDYEQTPIGGGKVTHSIYNRNDKNHTSPLTQLTTDEGEVGFQLPESDSTYLEIVGGSIVYGYGGGNNATVKKKNIIHVDNPSAVVNHIWTNAAGVEVAEGTTGAIDLLTTERFKEMGINTGFSHPSSGEYQIGRFFGGNNMAEMTIRPTWNLLAGKIRNLYSGGNRGNMTSSDGLLLEIKDYSSLIVDNLYGGCRMADVKPTLDGESVTCHNLPGYYFPDELSARTLVDGGHVNNVYGGNDVTGTVYGGNAIGIHTTVYGNVYGGGNGNYPYSDHPSLVDDDVFGDFNYSEFMEDQGISSSTAALNAFRPNAEQVSIRLAGKNATPTGYTVIQGSVYLGGNCATLVTQKKSPMVELKMGSYVIANNVFLGNNGEGMINPTYLEKYADDQFSSLELTESSVFRDYMDGVAMPLKPSVVFDATKNDDPATYVPFSSFVGSFYCGGNVGSMTIEGKETFTVDEGLNIFEKFVGGCNKADVEEIWTGEDKTGTQLCAAYEGGVIGTRTEQDNGYMDGDNIKDRIEINLQNMTITPLRWNDSYTQLKWNTNKWGSIITALEAGDELEEGDVYYTSDPYTENTVSGSAYTVTEDDEFFRKIDDHSYVTIATGTELPVDSKYYTLTGTKNTVGAVGHTAAAGEYLEEEDFVEVDRNPSDHDIRLLGGSVYGGCYESGHVNGNVVININEELLNKENVFGTKANAIFGNPASGVEVEDQRDDLMAVALTVFGAGYGLETEVWGSTTVNHNKGYAFQIFGGGEEGIVGKSVGTSAEDDGHYDEATGYYTINKKAFVFNTAYSSTVNLNGSKAIYSSTDADPDLAETEYIYGGGNEGDVCGNSYVNLGNGRIYDAFGGASDADILGHTQVIIGKQPDGAGSYKRGFPWIRDIVYGGNDFGGTIRGKYEDGFDYKPRIRDYETYKTQMHGYAEGKHDYMLKASSYVEYLEGRVDTIFGGGYGYYDYSNTELYGVGSTTPRQESSFVNIRPIDNVRNSLVAVFGGGTGFPGYRNGDYAQDHSYVLIDIPDTIDYFKDVQVFGAGSYNGLGMRESMATTFTPGYDQDKVSSVIDLLHGQISMAHGGSFQEGNTCRTVVNVPAESTINIKNIFGGSYGVRILPPCDVILSNVNYHNTSEKAKVTGAIYGGNDYQRRTLFTNVNISSPVWSDKSKGYLAKVYGAGKGFNSWSEHTLVNLLSGAKVYEAYGGGEMGHVLNAETVQHYMQNEKDKPSVNIAAEEPWNEAKRWDGAVGSGTVKSAYVDEWNKAWKDAWTLGHYYAPNDDFNNYFEQFAALRSTSLVRKSEIDERDYTGYEAAEKDKRYKINNTNVIINEGAEVVNYAYGGGLGDAASPMSGDVWGSTYIALLGGTVRKDIYAAGTSGSVSDAFARVGAYNKDSKPFGFTATATAYIKGGTCRNVYGGGWKGHVGIHTGGIHESNAGDIPGETHVVVGVQNATSFTDGVPAITRNVYGGGEGGSVYGTANVTVNNGYVGYRYKNTGTELAPTYEYVEELDDQKPGDLDLSGNVFGGGYVINSYVDHTNVSMYGGTVRGNLYGGGEIGPIGRGTVRYASTDGYTTNGLMNQNARIYKAGQTHVKMFNGHVMRNVYGGGRGYDNFGGDGTMYMDKDLVPTLDLKTKGFVFGQTDVTIYGGEVGTEEGLAYNYGNVFGGGDEGYVYSAYEQNGNLFIGNKVGARYDKGQEGYYYRYNGTKYVNTAGTVIADDAEKFLTEDCHVLVEPWLQVKTPIEYNAHTYNTGDYIPTAYLNTLPKKAPNETSWPAVWNKVDAGSLVGTEYKERGVIIHNAVFAGGNIAMGSELYANTKTVFGNATATIHDVYNRDLITIGTIHIGGLYGDGNLTFVDGYRELNITNYGTDYYNIRNEIDYTEYLNLPPREQAYYELKYRCLTQCTDKEGTTYTVGTSVPRDELVVLFDGIGEVLLPSGEPNPTYWTENGVVSRYAGRYMNTIQRADFCGVFGSRMVMKGAKDRVPEVADNTNYTINRVREVSLNKKASIAGDVGEFANHGNYFGIYNVVNHMGALSSDLDFYDAVRTTDNKDKTKYEANANGKAYGIASFADWKKQFHKDPRRNNGLSHNQLALASGVYLELTTEEKDGKTVDTKEWGIITGVVQLDLINVAKGVGGGFVYAKNIHGVRQETNKENTILTALNDDAVTNKSWKYIETDAGASSTQEEWQTSGNFVHNSQVIIDDCYNISNRYLMSNRVPAHYWYIRGSVYVYDQYITAHTGSANAFSKNEELPITISAAARNQMKLMDVRPNLYAYYSKYNASTKTGTKLGDEQKLLIQNEEYYLNTPISYWDWSQLPASERNLFVEETYITTEKCKIGSTIYPAGMVLLPSDYDAYEYSAEEQIIDGQTVKAVKKVVQDEEGNDVVAKDSEGNDIYVPFTSVFHSSNEMSHGTGYLLTYKMTNPGLWDTWYTQASSTTHDKSQQPATGWEDGPTYYLKGETGQVLGQHEYKVADIIPQSVVTKYTAMGEHIPNYGLEEGAAGYNATKKQATFGQAYKITAECSSATRHYYKGAPVSAAEGVSAGVSAAPAYVCTGTIQLGPTEYVFINDLLTADEKNALLTRFGVGGENENDQIYKDIDELIVPAYYCEKPGLYGGSYYEAGKNYRALEAWSSMSESDRENFIYNYDALDLLIDPDFGARYDDLREVWTQQEEGTKYQYDSAAETLQGAKNNPAHYSLETPLDYTATRYGTTLTLETGQKIKVTRGNTKDYEVTGPATINVNDTLARDEYEKLINEQYHYAPIDVTSENKSQPFYVVDTAFYYKEPFAAGQVIDKETYDGLPHSSELNLQNKVDVLDFSTAADGIYYYCRDEYKIDTNGTSVTNLGGTEYTAGKTVPLGTIINSGTYSTLKNQQTGFTIEGISPMETTTLYVTRDANYDNLSKEKIYTVIYQYDYEESDESGTHITPISERHVVRIHVMFENGIPTVEDIQEPDIVLPGNSITMRIPGVSSNGYEIIGGGWELFENKTDAESHFSGKDYQPSAEPLYWYQDEFYLAYYAKTYNRGKTYSNVVPVHVANYHDLKEVMDDKEYHLHVDYDRTRLKRDAKIYINDYSGSSQNGLQLFKNLYDLSLITTTTEGITMAGDSITNIDHPLKGHHLLNNSEATGQNIYDRDTYTKGVKAGKNLEFFFRTDINYPDNPETADWTPIGTADQCFEGTVHGDGHTISGLDNSLFKNLCGNVYNLGVTGSFNTAGVVDQGNGYVESCWTSTTGTPDGSVYAVFGAPERTSGEKEAHGAIQLVNSYYQEGKTYKTAAADHGVAKTKPAEAYYNGELAFDLNNFYLYKRYNDAKKTASGVEYKYWKDGQDALQTGHYADNIALCSSGYNHLKYVENRFADGDFRYAAGEIPESEDERYYEDVGKNSAGEDVVLSSGFYPIYPDDYIFFGQKLTYGWAAEAHQDVPTAVVRDEGRLSQNSDANRVFRAPAYYRNKTMDVAYFNPTAYLAQKSYDGTKTVQPGMTAIDFNGHQEGHAMSAYKLGLNDGWFYQPLLDDDGLVSIRNCDQTQNLLVYAPATSGDGYVNAKTHGVLTGYFKDPDYSDYYDKDDPYRRVSEFIDVINGHLVQSDLTAINDHLLVDKEEFNCPLAYDFDEDHLMWYQRRPDDKEYVNYGSNAGWQGISLPFTAELVTTHQKGEITHFFGGSASSYNSTSKKGHEYWLREFNDIKVETSPSDKATAVLRYPNAIGSEPKTVTNSFLWDYYYTGVHEQKDKNDDTYLQYKTYYKDPREYNSYPLAGAATPYILGLPGQTYYEFDLSGNFVAKNTAKDDEITKLAKQIITFASKPQESIKVSDDEILAAKAAYTMEDNEHGSSKNFQFTFAPTYLKQTLEENDYALNADGNAFNKVGAGSVTTVPFRPYFTATSTAKVKRMLPEYIVFSGVNGDEFEEEPESALNGSLEIFTRGHNIVTRSRLTQPTDIRIVNVGGITIATFVLQPGETIETPVQAQGTYIVNKKKIFVK